MDPEFEALKQWHDVQYWLQTKYNCQQAWDALQKDNAITSQELSSDPNATKQVFALLKKDALDRDTFNELWSTWEYKYQEQEHKNRLLSEKKRIHDMLEQEEKGDKSTSKPQPIQDNDTLSDISSKLDQRLTFAERNKDKLPKYATANIFSDIKVQHQELVKDLAISKLPAHEEKKDDTGEQPEKKGDDEPQSTSEKKPEDAPKQPNKAQNLRTTYLQDYNTPKGGSFLTPLKQQQPIKTKTPFLSPKTFFSSPGPSNTLSIPRPSKERGEVRSIRQEMDEYLKPRYMSVSPSRTVSKGGLEQLMDQWSSKKRSSNFAMEYRAQPTIENSRIQSKVQSIKDKLKTLNVRRSQPRASKMSRIVEQSQETASEKE